MQKLFYLLRDAATADGDALRQAILERAVPAIHASGGREVTVFAADPGDDLVLARGRG